MLCLIELLIYTFIMFEKYLEEIGLSEKEAQVYLALLQVDSDSIQDIAKKTGINRTTVYPVLESLAKKGLVGEIQDGKKTNYQAAAPERLETFVERQKVTLEEHAARLKDVIPQIKSIQREHGERPVVKLFDGREGAISAYEEFFNIKDEKEKEGYFLFNQNILQQVFTEEERARFRKIRVGKEVYPNTIYNNKDGDGEFTSKGTRLRINDEKYPIKVDMTTIGDSVIITTLGKKMMSLVIKSSDIADTFKSIFKYVHDHKN